MAVLKFTQEIKVKVSAKRMFKAYATETEMYDVLPKIVPNAIKSIELLEGDGGVGTLRQTNFQQGLPFSYSKQRIEKLDAENLLLGYTLVEGSILGRDDCLESVYYDQKYEDTPDGGCIIKIVRECRTKGDAKVDEEIVKAEEGSYLRITKLVEEYLLAHPQVCA